MRLALALLLLPAPALAHPHVFVDSDVDVVMDGAGQVLGVRMTWAYDEFFSLLLTEDLGLDADGDMVLTDDEAAALEASVTAWPPDYSGDLTVLKDGAPLPLGERRDHRVTFEDGRVVERHFRPLAAPAPAPVTVQNFDPYYYVAYTVADARIENAGDCSGRLIAADLEAAQAEIDAVWQGLDVAGAGQDVQLPPVGYAFTDSVEVACAG